LTLHDDFDINDSRINTTMLVPSSLSDSFLSLGAQEKTAVVRFLVNQRVGVARLRDLIARHQHILERQSDRTKKDAGTLRRELSLQLILTRLSCISALDIL
jgi:hypothetical protein